MEYRLTMNHHWGEGKQEVSVDLIFCIFECSLTKLRMLHHLKLLPLYLSFKQTIITLKSSSIATTILIF